MSNSFLGNESWRIKQNNALLQIIRLILLYLLQSAPWPWAAPAAPAPRWPREDQLCCESGRPGSCRSSQRQSQSRQLWLSRRGSKVCLSSNHPKTRFSDLTQCLLPSRQRISCQQLLHNFCSDSPPALPQPSNLAAGPHREEEHARSPPSLPSSGGEAPRAECVCTSCISPFSPPPSLPPPWLWL